MITVRKSTEADIDFVSAHAYRLVEFGPPAWHDQQEMTQADIQHNIDAIRSNDPDIGTFIAIDSNGDRCGFIYLTMQPDYYTNEKNAHITDIVVTREAEGKGAGKLLMQKAEEWAREKNARWVTLHVFAENTHAQAVYEKVGYQKEWIRYLKQLD
jgi:ribosomal protein S18 acetylase RimI-like enzyme